MRIFVVVVALGSLSGIVCTAQARALTSHDRYICNWGSSVAGSAQAAKLSRVSLYGARNKVQARKYPQPWMRMMALGITEQTYDSASRLKPAAVRQTYYEDCIKHEMARR
ncbi:hypothetical protein [Pseudomonas huanghezhanensis]|uniref:hypothetical protein n=1 Tax=Pseudomonas huanghezhanensis TaxID=3002903 RepID=UPI002285E1C2|nr:hypothetical protein [Pseudomonas sp. BSw22131]